MERAFGGWARLRARSPAAIVRTAKVAEEVGREGPGNTDQGIPVQRGPFASQVGVRQRSAMQAQLERDLHIHSPVPAPTGLVMPAFAGDAAPAASVVPADRLLDPPERAHFYGSILPLEGARLGQLVAGADVALAAADPSRFFCGFSTVSDDAAERFAAGMQTEDVRALPPCVLMAGTTDATVPWYESTGMAHALHEAGARVRLLLYARMSHASWVTSWPPWRLRRGCQPNGNYDVKALMRCTGACTPVPYPGVFAC